MSTCVNININSKEWKALTAEIGQFEAVRDFMEYDRIRTVNEVRSDKPQLFKKSEEEQLGAVREDVKYQKITVKTKNNPEFKAILDKFNIKQSKSHFYFVTTKEQEADIKKWLSLAAKNKDPKKRLLGSTRKGFSLESQEKGTKNWQKGELTIKIESGVTYLFIEDKEKIIDTIDGIKMFRYPIKGFYKIPLDVVGASEEKTYINSQESKTLYVPFIQREVNKYLIKTQGVTPKKSANFYLLQVKSLIKKAFNDIQKKNISYEDLKNLSQAEADKLFKDLGVLEMLDTIKEKFKNYINSLNKQDLVNEIIDLYNVHLPSATKVSLEEKFLKNINAKDTISFKEYINYFKESLEVQGLSETDIDFEVNKLLKEVYKDEYKDIKQLKAILEYLPEEFLKLITFKYVNFETAYFSQQSEKNITEFNQLESLVDIYDIQSKMGLNLAIRRMKEDGLISEDAIKELNNILTPLYTQYVTLLQNKDRLSHIKAECFKQFVIRKIKRIKSLNDDIKEALPIYLEQAIDDIKSESNQQNKGLIYLASLISKNLKGVNSVFSEVVLGELNPDRLKFKYDKITVALHELGHALDKYLYVTNKKDRDRILTFIDKLKETSEFQDYLEKGLKSRGYDVTNQKEITADLYAYLLGKATNKDFTDTHLESLNLFFNNNKDLAEKIFTEVFGSTYKKVDSNFSVSAPQNKLSISELIKDFINELIDAVNKLIGKNFFKHFTTNSELQTVKITGNEIVLVDMFDKLRDIIIDKSNFDIDSIINSEYSEMNFMADAINNTSGISAPSIKPGVSELFESNPELANAVYEALGFETNISIPNYEVVTRPTKDIGKSKGRTGNFVEITTPDNYRTNMSAYMVQTNDDGKLFITDIEKYNKDSTFKGFGSVAYVDFFENYKNQGITTDKKLTADGIKLLERLEKIGLVYKTDAKLIDDSQVSKVYNTKIYEYNKPLYEFNLNWSRNQTTAQQKQQAQQLYSQYVEQTGKQDIEGFKEFVNENKQTTSTDPMFYRELPIESTEEFFANYVPEMNEQEQKNARANEIVNKLVERLRNALGIEASVITSDEARAMLAAYGHGYNNEPGFFFDGKVYLVGDKVTTETVFHEFAHPLLKAIRATNPTLFTNLYKRLEQTAEGKAIIEGVRAAYPDKVFGSPEFMEEVLAHALGKKADNINRSVPESTGFTKFIKDLLYAIKQLFRSVFKGGKIRIENLDVNTTLDELANMLVNESFVINTDVIKESAPEFIRNLNNEFVKEVAQIEQKRLRLISKALFNMSKKQRRLLDYTNYRETRNILKDEMGRSDFSEIISALYTYQTEGTQAFSTPEEEEAFLNSHAVALLNSILRLETGAERVLKHFKTIVDKIEDDTITPEEKQKALLSAFYLNRVIKDWREFIEEAKTQLRAANVPSNHEIFGILNNVTEKLDRTKTLSDKIYTEGVGEMLTDQLTTLMDNINKHYETILNNYRSRGASPEIIKLYEDEFDAVKLTPEKIKQYLLGELGDAHALNVFLEGFAHAQDPIIMGFAGYVKDRFVAMSSKIHENYYNFINDIEDLVNKAGYTSAYSRMTMGKDMLYLDIVERDENGLPTKTVWKYLTPFKDYKGKYRQLKLEKDKLKKLVETENTDEAKQKYVLAIAALESFEKAYMNRKYTEAFYEKERFFQDEIGLEAMRRRDAILDIIRSIKSGIQDPDDIIKNTELTKRYWREYKQLSSLYNLDGTPKDPDSMEYKVAQRLQEYKNFVKKFYDVVPLSGVFENAYLNFIRNLKLQGLSPDEMSIKIEEWTKLNTVKKLSSEFYEERGEVLLKLRQLSANDPNQLRITEIFDEINRLLSMYKDDNGHPEGSSIPLSVAERIKALEDEFQDLKSDDYFDFKGTEKIVRENYISNFSDYQKYLAGDTSAWADKSDDEILDLVNFMAYAENALMSPIVNRLVSEFSATNGRDPSASELTDIQTKALSILNSAIEKRALLAKLMDLSKREMTEDYVDMINNFIDASPEAIEFLKEATNRPDEGFNIDTVKSIFLSTVLPKLKEINPSITFTDISGNSSTITFSEWFDNNHIVNVYQSDTGEEQIKYTPTRLWTYTAPKEDRYYETTKFNDPETGEEIEIIGVPSLEYTTRIVKDSYVDDNGNTILLKTPRISMLDCIRQGIGIENATIDMHGDWLPKYNVPNSPYVNSDFAQLRATSPDKYNLLMALLKKHLEIQEELPYDSRLDLEYERYRASQYEVVTSKSETEGGGNPISKYFRNLRQYFAKTADNYEHGLNMEEREMFVKSDLFDDEYAKVPITGLYFIDPNLVSMDMITSISRYMQSAVKQRTLIDMLPMARVLQKITVENPPYEVKESVINSFKKGRLANRVASSIATPFGAKGNNFRAAALNAFIEKEFEGKNVSGWGSDTVSNFANTLLSLSSKTFFSFNLPSALKNSMGARWQSLIQGAAGNNFNSKDYALGTLWANKVTSEITLQIHKFGKKSLNYQLVELMDPTQERLSSGIREGKGISKSVGKDAFEFKYATNVREWTQLNASLSIFGAMLNKTLVDYTAPNGTVTKIKYSDAWEVVNGKLQLKQGVDQTYAPGGKNYVKFVKNLHGVTNKINGAYDSFNQPLAARYLLYRMIMHLKKYFMELFMERFKFRYSAKHGMIVPRYDGYTDSIGMGYYVEFLRAAKRFFGVYKMNFHNMTDTERQASKKVMMEGGLLLLFNLVLLGLLFGWDDDDEEKYAKLRAKSDALPLPFVTDNPDRDFKLNGWFSNHLLNLTMQIEAENDSWIPVPGLGLNDYADIFQLNSVALSSTIGSYTNIINQLYQMADYAVTGDTDALYKRTAGPYDWQTEGKFKFWNHLGKILTFTGTSVEPIKNIENLQRRENL